ncbi:MAG: choice-of-anchor Q domain-containing protein, partial [Desulfocapsaceae bacterium]|nr:choice-of-anchor Q domain-containing protein [Desulfocapsaceae bacterium]
PPATPTTITLASQLTVTRNLTINGNGRVILDANQTGRVMLIDDGTAAIMSVSISGITFKNGLVTGPGGGIYTKEHLTLANSIFTNNTATNSSGGAIHNETGATLTLSDSSFTANNALHGGAIHNIGPLSVSGCTFNANHANSTGGAIRSETTTTLTNSTVSGNSAPEGGGLYNYNSTITINNSTVAYNSASGSGGGLHLNQATLNLNSSIVSYNYNAANSAPDIYNYFSTINADHSLVATAAGHTITNGVNNNIVGQEAKLDVLKDNGGTTKTHMLLTTSPAIGTGDNPSGLTTDQRGAGFPRLITSIDMGAVETDTGQVIIPWTVNSANDSGAGTLREALENAPAGKVIDFDPTVFPPATPTTITLASQLTVTRNLTINGNGRVILDANQTGRVMLIDDGTAA